MELYLSRYDHGEDHTAGLLRSCDGFLGYLLEDEYRSVKVKGETRIPAGRYEIKKRMEVTPLTERYRKKFQWFDFHLELQDVPNFNNVYIHIGNYERDTDGCLLVGNGTLYDPVRQIATLTNSTACYKSLYKLITNWLLVDQVFINIADLTL